MDESVRKQHVDDYYQKLIDIWDHGGPNGTAGGWAGCYYGIFSKIIRENNFKRCAEVGIGYGFHAREILDNTNCELLYLIDPMQYYANDAFATDVINFGGFEKLVKNIKIHLAKHENNYVWFRKPSITISNNEIVDGSLDAVFVDADHSYDAVSKDLPFWYKKLKMNGWLLGDDYDSCWPETKKAVDDFVAKNKLEINFLSKPDATKQGYPIYKIVKTFEIV